ncbi:DUF881 domain-containing protein [Cellulosimicrobium sp. Marseille-Q4280]|uniref:DUF881 domain-containing protein n=1 Tax=Cellulosimicrobium sp. Marseille-Q4280 TaxID=2937992 RepID=UPI00203B6B69|nr:DUF881 domain-containing protein [Cellulosimicrobium sp. Marseille-Q4280]
MVAAPTGPPDPERDDTPVDETPVDETQDDRTQDEDAASAAPVDPAAPGDRDALGEDELPADAGTEHGDDALRDPPASDRDAATPSDDAQGDAEPDSRRDEDADHPDAVAADDRDDHGDADPDVDQDSDPDADHGADQGAGGDPDRDRRAGEPPTGDRQLAESGAPTEEPPASSSPVDDTADDSAGTSDRTAEPVEPVEPVERAPRGAAATSDEPTTTPHRPAPGGRHGGGALPEPQGLRGLGRVLRPRASRSQIIVGLLCALVGFALVAQVSQTQEDQLSSLRQSDLVRLLDDVTQRSGELEDQVSSLEATRDELQSGSGRARAALEVAQQQEQTQGILSGRLPAQGPGVEIEVVEGETPLDAFSLFNVLEELRNAGAEAMEVNGVRLVASSYFEDTTDGVVVDGQPISSPYRWTVIGDPSTLETALEIPGGAMATLRADGARTTIRQQETVDVTSTREPAEPRYATPVPADD